MLDTGVVSLFANGLCPLARGSLAQLHTKIVTQHVHSGSKLSLLIVDSWPPLGVVFSRIRLPISSFRRLFGDDDDDEEEEEEDERNSLCSSTANALELNLPLSLTSSHFRRGQRHGEREGGGGEGCYGFRCRATVL